MRNKLRVMLFNVKKLSKFLIKINKNDVTLAFPNNYTHAIVSIQRNKSEKVSR